MIQKGSDPNCIIIAEFSKNRAKRRSALPLGLSKNRPQWLYFVSICSLNS